jgi:hypothetical protein
LKISSWVLNCEYFEWDFFFFFLAGEFSKSFLFRFTLVTFKAAIEFVKGPQLTEFCKGLANDDDAKKLGNDFFSSH